MKTRALLSWLLGFGLIFGPSLAGLAQDIPHSSLVVAKDVIHATNSPLTASAPVSQVTIGSPETRPVQSDADISKVPASQKPVLSGWLLELVKLAQAGIEEPVVLSFIDSAGTFNLGSDQIIYLRDIGVSSQVISMILQHDAELAAGQRQVSASTVPGAEPLLQITFASARGSASVATNQSPALAIVTPWMPATESIVNEVGPGPGGWEYAVATETASTSASTCKARRCAARRPPSPVREPYAVKLTDPIVMIKAEGPTANLLVIHLFP